MEAIGAIFEWAGVLNGVIVVCISGFVSWFISSRVSVRVFAQNKNRELKEKCYVDYINAITECDAIYMSISCELLTQSAITEDLIKRVGKERNEMMMRIARVRGAISAFASADVVKLEYEYWLMIINDLHGCEGGREKVDFEKQKNFHKLFMKIIKAIRKDLELSNEGIPESFIKD